MVSVLTLSLISESTEWLLLSAPWRALSSLMRGAEPDLEPPPALPPPPLPPPSPPSSRPFPQPADTTFDKEMSLQHSINKLDNELSAAMHKEMTLQHSINKLDKELSTTMHNWWQPLSYPPHPQKQKVWPSSFAGHGAWKSLTHAPMDTHMVNSN